MKILEFHHHNDKVKFDVVDDAIVFMRNDPMFYRQEYYPRVCKLADRHREGKKTDPMKLFAPMVEKACDAYTERYKLSASSNDLFRQQERNDIIQRIYQEEMKAIGEGDYK